MKTYRPYTSGFIVLYALATLCILDAGYSLYGQVTGTANPYMQSFSMFSYLIAALAIVYVRMYFKTRITIDGRNIRIVFPAYIRPPEGSKRAFFVFRQGQNDLKLIDKAFSLDTVERYGFVDDFNLSHLDQSGANEKTPLFKVKEICFLTSNGKRYHMNAGFFKKKQLANMFRQIRDIIGKDPEGSLAELLK
ncbi:MAG: hypothetical protein IJJ45_10965 [Clostridia bacterium]|nr:hypothetical protein [Clostridia bacterium]